MSLGRRLFVTLAILLPLGVAGGLVWLFISGKPSERSAGSKNEATELPAPPTPSATPTPTVGDPAEPLRGKVVVLDPGHNPSNHEHPDKIARSVDIGTGKKQCDTTGTTTGSGGSDGPGRYTEAEFTLAVAREARALLRERGATVRLTHNGDRPYGPCIDERARIGNRAEADAVVSVHADGTAGKTKGKRGFHVILPASVRAGDADTAAITGPSRRLGELLADRFAKATDTEPTNYLGKDPASSGLVTRDDLGGLNLSRVPKVFIECGNMREPRDAALLTDPAWQSRAARGITDGIAAYLGGKQ